MAKDVQIYQKLDTMRSLPSRLEWLASSLGTVRWPGQPQRLNFPSGMELTAEDREDLKRRRVEMATVLDGTNLTQDQSSKARLALLTQMLLAYPVAGNSSEASATARLNVYKEAISDIAPWAVHFAMKAWARGEVPPRFVGVNFSFSPSPADLRMLCIVQQEPFRAQLAKIDRLLLAVPIDRAMDPKPLEQEGLRIAGQPVKLKMIK